MHNPFKAKPSIAQKSSFSDLVDEVIRVKRASEKSNPIDEFGNANFEKSPEDIRGREITVGEELSETDES